MVRITYVLASGEKREVLVGRGSNLRLAAGRAGIRLHALLHGLCTACRVKVLEGGEHLSPPSAIEKWRLGRLLTAGVRLACQVQVYGPVKVALHPDLATSQRPSKALQAGNVPS